MSEAASPSDALISLPEAAMIANIASQWVAFVAPRITGSLLAVTVECIVASQCLSDVNKPVLLAFGRYVMSVSIILHSPL